MSIIGYGRVSTTDQSLDVQIGQLSGAGCEKIFCEKESGAKDNRPELESALQYVRQGDVFVVCKLDRLARSTQHLLNVVSELDGKGVALRILNINLDTSTPTGKLMLTMLGAIATFERELMLERQRDGIIRAKAAGKYVGREPVARRQLSDITRMLGEGATKREVAEKLDIGIASVYRVLRENKRADI